MVMASLGTSHQNQTPFLNVCELLTSHLTTMSDPLVRLELVDSLEELAKLSGKLGQDYTPPSPDELEDIFGCGDPDKLVQRLTLVNLQIAHLRGMAAQQSPETIVLIKEKEALKAQLVALKESLKEQTHLATSYHTKWSEACRREVALKGRITELISQNYRKEKATTQQKNNVQALINDLQTEVETLKRGREADRASRARKKKKALVKPIV